jgi:hypothetical protein
MEQHKSDAPAVVVTAPSPAVNKSVVATEHQDDSTVNRQQGILKRNKQPGFQVILLYSTVYPVLLL